MHVYVTVVFNTMDGMEQAEIVPCAQQPITAKHNRKFEIITINGKIYFK